MLKVECESCKAPYQVDERRVPPTGLKMRCPKCGHTFLVTDPSKAGAAPAGPAGGAPPPAMRAKKPTMVGVGAFNPNAAAPPPPAPAPAPAPPPEDDGLALPAVKPAAKPAARPAPAPAPMPKAPAALPGLDDLDLPALAGDVGLPAPAAARGRPAPAPAPHLGHADLPATKGAPGFGALDLPMAKGPQGGGGFGSVDLPTAKGGGGFGSVDLPMAKPGGGFGDLPTAKPGFGSIDLPTAKGPGGGGFGSIDLPAPRAGSDLPMLQNDLPLVGGGLPSLHQGNNLPAPQNALPARKGGFGEIDLPSVQNDLPNPMGAQAHMPMPVSDDRLLPNRQGGGGGGPGMSFGELDLPLVGNDGGAPRPPGGQDAVSFGELDLPNDASLAQASPVGAMGGMPMGPGPGQGAPSHGTPGGMGFGEVDLGGGSEPAGPMLGPPPATSAGNFAFQEASLESAGGPQVQRPPPRPMQTPRTSSKAPKLLALLAILVVGGGAALELTPVGAFGRNFLSDRFNRGNYQKNAQTLADAARKKVDLDTYAQVSAAADELGDARKKSPRSRPLSAYAAFTEFSAQVRFGANAERLARAKTFIADLPPNTSEPYLAAALAAQEAASGDLAKAKGMVDEAMVKERSFSTEGGIQQDLALLKAEILLASKDYRNAAQAFDAASKTAPSARATYGLARAQYGQKKLDAAKRSLDETLKLSPNHPGALTLSALYLFETKHQETEPLAMLGKVLDANARKTEGPSEVSTALAAKGMVMLGRDRAGEARAAFDEAVKIDTRNVLALVGQGEVLYADGRNTEALTRFDEAVQKDPTNLPAIIGAAKTKLKLEKFADAKTQLTNARKVFPKDMGLALWLAKTEDALNNRAEAEKYYQAAIDLADPQNPEAITAYAQYASFLAMAGKTADAQAKLDQARAKLPDSPALQRAFGEVAAAQGHYAEAVGHYQAALEKNPNDLGTHFRLGAAYGKMNQLDKAAEELDKVAAIDREYPGIALERGLLFEKSGDIQKALEQFNQAYQKAPKDIDLKLRVGAAYVAVGRIDEALPLLNDVKKVLPNSAEANHYLGRAYLKQGGLEQAAAMRYLQRAVEIDPNRAEYHLYVAWAANEQGQLGLARTEVDKALALDRLLADGYWQRGIVERRDGRINDAIKDLNRALELKPSRNEAHATLAECFEQKNDVVKAMAEWQKAIAHDDKQPSWRWQYGKLLREKGNAAEAAKHLTFAVAEGKKAQPRPGWVPKAAFEAGEALRKIGQKKEAAEHYQLFVELAPPSDPDMRDAKRYLKELGVEPK